MPHVTAFRRLVAVVALAGLALPSCSIVQDFPWTSSRAGPTSPPKTSTIAWWPRQTPSVGVVGARRRTISSVAPAAAG